MPIDLSKLNISDTSDIDDIVNELFSEESPKVNTQEPIKEVPGASVPSYQTKPEDVGFENVLDKKGFEQRYNVNPNVLSGRQTDPIQKSIESLREKVGKKSNIPQYPLGNRYTYGFGSDYANKTADVIAEKQLSAATENELRGAEKAQSKGGFWDSFGRGLKDEGMWTQGLSEFDNNMTLLYIAKKAEKEGFDKLPEREQDLLTASALRIASEAANSDEKTAMQIAGMSTAESIPYMLQFMLTSSPASMVTSPVRTAIKKAAEKAIRSGVSSKLIPVIKGAARTAAVTTKAGAMSAMQPTMYADAVSRGTGKATLDENGKYAGMEDAESTPVAAYKAFANATVENLSEHSGAMLSGAAGAAARTLKKVPALGGFISNVQKNNVLSGATKMMKAVGFNGAPEEFFEEQVSTGLNSLIVGDSQFSDFTNWKQQLATLISVGATAGAMTSTGSLMSVPYKKQIKNNYSEATDLVKDYFSPDEFDQFRASLSNMNIDSRPDFISSVAEAKGFSVDEVKDLTVFATRQAQYDGYVGSVTDKIEEEKIQAQNEINQVSNKDMGEILEVNGFGENPVNIVGGFVVFDDEGYVDKNKSSQTIYYLDEEGKRKMASPDKFGQLISRKPLADAYAEALNSVEENILVQEENDLADEETPEQAQQDAVLLAENGNQVETPEGVGTISQVEQDENAAIVLFPNGISKKFALPELKQAPVAQEVVDQQTQSPIEEANPALQSVESDVAPTQAAPIFPVDKENNIDYSQIQEPEMYAQALQSEFEGDAVSVIDEQIQSAQARLEKAGKNSDAIKRRRAMKSEQAEVDRLNKVKAILSPSEQIVNEMPAENVENEESSPGEEINMIDLSQQPVLETTETEAGNEGEKEGIEPTPEEIAEIEAQLEKPKRRGTVIDIINEIATEQNLRDAEKETSVAEEVPASEDPVEDELLYRESNNDSKSANEGDNLLSLGVINKGEIDYDKLKEISGRIESGGSTITRLNSAEERGRIKGGRRAIEASILTGATRRTDRRGLPPSESEEVILKKYAEKEGILFSREDIENMSERKMPSGAESEVYESKDGKSVIKIVNYKMYSDSPLEFLDNRVSLNNYLFNETPYTLIGFTETKKGLSFVLTQPFIQGKNLSALAMTVQELVKQQSRVAMYMKDKFDMNPIDSSPTSFTNSNYVIEDLHLNNVKEGADGNLYFIDSIISLNEPSDNIGGHREYEEFGVNEDELMFRDGPSETEQIKSATNNTGEFNPNNDDIRFRDAEIDRLDKEYLDAVESGDMEKAQRMVDQVAKNNGYVSSSDYRMTHQAPTSSKEGISMDKVVDSDIVPEDYWTTPRYYLYERYDYDSYNKVKRAMKDGVITMYRSIPKDSKDSKFRNGDWVTPSKEYAKQEGANIPGGYRIIEESVPVENAYWDGNDINEWGFDDGKGYSYKNTKNNKKLNEAITRDDEGSIIPPSKRFNDRKSDPRYRGVFYSNAENAVKSIKQDKATPEQWLKMIEKTGGLKAGEDKWMGLSEWLKNSEAKTLTKQEVLDFINQNQIVVEEVQLGEGTDKKIMTGEAKHNIDIFDLTYKYINNNLVEGEENYDNRLRSIMTNANSIKGFDWVNTVDDLKKAKEMVINAPESYTTVKVSDINSIRLDYSTKGLENKREIVLTIPSIASWNEDDEIHFGAVSQGREVGWVRFGETTDSEGNRVMVIDEIQSKRHQQGREKGYSDYDAKSMEGKWNSTKKELSDFHSQMREKYEKSDYMGDDYKNSFTQDEKEKDMEIKDRLSSIAKQMDKIPDAPFDKNWHELAMKRALRYAAENGFDKVAWTKGDQQAERYDLSNQINLIDVNTNAKPDRAVYVKMKGGNDITMFVDSNAMVQSTAGSIGMDVKGKRLDEVIGKEMAQKVMQVTNPTVFKDLELKVGGEGMKSFYDKMLPSFMNKYGKRWGVTVGEVILPNVEESARTMHSVDVTEDMKASVMEGQPMFKDSASEAKEVSNVEKEATTLAGSLNTPIRVIRDVNEITNEDKRKEKRMRSAKGWYDPKTGEVVIVLPNAESVGDVQATILHEIVGHKGLRGLLGDKFEEMMDKVYKHLPKATRKKIMESAVNKYRFDHRTATEEYLAEFVEKDVMEPSIWQKIKSAIKSFFRDLGVNLEMNDADIAYLLWKSKNRLLKGDGPIEAINKVAAGEEAKERFREAAYTDADVLSDELDQSAREAWERLSKDQRSVHEIVNETAEVRKGILKYVPTNENVKKSIYELTQGWFDNAVSLRILQHLVNTASDQPIESFANPYQFLTTIPARNENKMNTFVKTKFSKIGQAIKELGVPQSTVQIYAYLKHGLERNEYMRAQDVREKGEKLKEAADLRIQAIADSIEAMSRQLETADKKGTDRILAKIEGYNLAIEGIKSELESKKQEYEKSVSLKDYSGVYAVADLFIKKSDDREFTVAQIETAIEEFEKEHDVTKFWEAINGATKWTVQNEFEMGRISKDLRDKLFSMYKYYIPLKGWEEKNANEEWDYISGGGAPVSPIKKAGGRKSLASNLFENIGLGAQTSVMGGHKNLLKLHALRMVRNYPNPMYRVSEVWAVKEGDDWVQKAPEYSEDPEVYADNVVKFEEEMNELKGLGLANKLGGKLNVGRPITKYEAKEHEILVYENGKPYVIYINGNPDIARAINLTGNKPYEVGGEDPTRKDLLKWGINKAMALMRFTGQNLTSRFPGFIAANLLMDTQWAILSASAKEGSVYAGRLVGNYMSPSIHRSIMRGVRGKLDESNPIDKLFGEFQRAGGETGYSDLFKVEDFEKMIKDELKDGVDWRKVYTWYTGSIETLNRWAELASRFSTYVTSRNSGRDIERSAYDAKEITLNFNRKGTGAFGANWLKFAYLFAGAGLQGTYSMANLALSKRSRKRITMVFAGTAMLGFIVPLINDMFLGGDDDDLYSKKPDYERKSNILVRIPGSDSFLKLPLPQPLRPFYNIGESLYQMVKGNRNSGEGTMDIIGGFGMMLPFDPFGGSSLMMSAFQPAYQIKENKDFFGQKIFKDDSFTQYDPEFKRAFSNTSPAFVELTRALNDVTGGDEVTKGWLNLNPGILEHLTEGYLGGAFKFVNDIGKQVNGAHEVYKGNPYPYDSRSYPIIGRFYTNTAATSDINAEYYKYVNDAEEISHRVKKYQDLGKKGDQEAFDKSLELINSKEYQNAIFVNRMKSQIDNVKKIAKDAEGETLKMLKEQEKELKIMMLNEIDKLNEK